MKLLKLDTGGRPRANDDFETLQREVYAAITAPLVGQAACILEGCQVRDLGGQLYDVAPGIVWLAGELLRFDGAASVALPAELAAGPLVGSNPRTYQVGGTRNCMEERKAMLQATSTAGDTLPLAAWGGLRLAHVQRAATRRLGEVQHLANLVGADYETNGKGRPGTEAWGWALCNGNNGTADLRGLFIAAFNPDKGYHPGLYQSLTTNAVGDIGGAERVALQTSEMPRHRHQMTIYKVDSPGSDWRLITGGNNGAQNNASNASQANDNYTQDQGNGQAHENRPPYYVLAMCQWVGFA